MKKNTKIILALLITSFLIAGYFLVLYSKNNALLPVTSTKTDEVGIGCGGDWNYKVKCPEGTYCKSLNKGPLAGGLCTKIGN